MTQTQIAGVAMLILWPIAMLTGYTFGGLAHIALGLALFRWYMDVPKKDQAKKPYRSPRRYG